MSIRYYCPECNGFVYRTHLEGTKLYCDNCGKKVQAYHSSWELRDIREKIRTELRQQKDRERIAEHIQEMEWSKDKFRDIDSDEDEENQYIRHPLLRPYADQDNENKSLFSITRLFYRKNKDYMLGRIVFVILLPLLAFVDAVQIIGLRVMVGILYILFIQTIFSYPALWILSPSFARKFLNKYRDMYGLDTNWKAILFFIAGVGACIGWILICALKYGVI